MCSSDLSSATAQWTLGNNINGSVAASVTRYQGLGAGASSSAFVASTLEGQRAFVLQHAATISNLYVTTGSTAQSSTGNCVITVRKNFANTTLTVTIPASGIGKYQDTVHTVSFAKFDTITTEFVNNATTVSTAFQFLGVNVANQ